MTSNPVYRFFATETNTGPTLLRLLLAGFFAYHAAQKLFGWLPQMELLTDWSAITLSALPTALAFMLKGVELVLSLLFFLGLLTRLAALVTLALMAAALYTIHLNDGLAAMQHPLTIAVIALSLLFLGAGRFSLDRAISRNLLPTIG